MNAILEMLEAEALKLSSSDRSHLLERLMESLDEDSEIEAAWDAIADSREAQATSDGGGAVSMEHAFARLESRFPG